MRKKSMPVGVVLGIFGFAGFYTDGVKMGAIFFIVMSVLYYLIAMVSPDLYIIGVIIGGAGGYYLTKQHNEKVAKAEAESAADE